MLKFFKKVWKNEFFLGGIFLTSSSYAGHLMNYIFSFLTGRTLGPQGYAEIVTLFSYTLIATVPISVLSTFLIQKISSAQRNQNLYVLTLENLFWQKIKRWWLMIIPFIAITPFLPSITNLSALASWSLLPLIILSLLATFYGAALQGLKLFLAISLIGIVATFLKLMGAVSVILGIDGIATIIFFLIFSNLFLFYASCSVITRFLQKATKTKPKYINKRIVEVFKNKQFIIIFASTLALTLFNNIDIVVVKKFFTSHEAGIYASWSLFAKIILYFLSPLISISFVFFASNKHSNSQTRTLHLSLALLFAVGLVSFLFYTYSGTFIINSLFGKKFIGVVQYLSQASIFGTLYAGISFINSYFLAKNSIFALILPICIPIYIVFLFFLPKQIDNVIRLDIIFSIFVLLMYFLGYLKSYSYSNSKSS